MIRQIVPQSFATDLGETPWGTRESVVKDCDGRLLAFGSAAG